MSALNEQLLEIVRSHADTARAGYKSRDHEVALLKAQIAVLETRITDQRIEIIGLRAELRRHTGVPSTVQIATASSS